MEWERRSAGLSCMVLTVRAVDDEERKLWRFSVGLVTAVERKLW